MNTIKLSNYALNLIPQEKVIVFSTSWEDSNIFGNEQAKTNCQKIGTGVMLLTGDYIIPPCSETHLYPNDHYHCQVYDPTYTVAWVSDQTWQELGESVMKADQEWREQANACKGEYEEIEVPF